MTGDINFLVEVTQPAQHFPADDAAWRELENLRSGVSLFVWEAPPGDKIGERINGMDLDYVILNPAANNSGEAWLATQHDNVRALQTILNQVNQTKSSHCLSQ